MDLSNKTDIRKEVSSEKHASSANYEVAAPPEAEMSETPIFLERRGTLHEAAKHDSDEDELVTQMLKTEIVDEIDSIENQGNRDTQESVYQAAEIESVKQILTLAFAELRFHGVRDFGDGSKDLIEGDIIGTGSTATVRDGYLEGKNIAIKIFSFPLDEESGLEESQTDDGLVQKLANFVDEARLGLKACGRIKPPHSGIAQTIGAAGRILPDNSELQLLLVMEKVVGRPLPELMGDAHHWAPSAASNNTGSYSAVMEDGSLWRYVMPRALKLDLAIALTRAALQARTPTPSLPDPTPIPSLSIPPPPSHRRNRDLLHPPAGSPSTFSSPRLISPLLTRSRSRSRSPPLSNSRPPVLPSAPQAHRSGVCHCDLKPENGIADDAPGRPGAAPSLKASRPPPPSPAPTPSSLH